MAHTQHVSNFLLSKVWIVRNHLLGDFDAILYEGVEGFKISELKGYLEITKATGAYQRTIREIADVIEAEDAEKKSKITPRGDKPRICGAQTSLHRA